MANDNVVPLKKLTKAKMYDALDTLSRLKTSAASAAGEIGPMMKKFEEDYGVSKSVLGWLSKLDRMSEEKKADYVRSLEQALPLMKERLKMGDLFSEPEKKAPFFPGKPAEEKKAAAAAKAKETA